MFVRYPSVVRHLVALFVSSLVLSCVAERLDAIDLSSLEEAIADTPLSAWIYSDLCFGSFVVKRGLTLHAFASMSDNAPEELSVSIEHQISQGTQKGMQPAALLRPVLSGLPSEWSDGHLTVTLEMPESLPIASVESAQSGPVFVESVAFAADMRVVSMGGPISVKMSEDEVTHSSASVLSGGNGAVCVEGMKAESALVVNRGNAGVSLLGGALGSLSVGNLGNGQVAACRAPANEVEVSSLAFGSVSVAVRSSLEVSRPPGMTLGGLPGSVPVGYVRAQGGEVGPSESLVLGPQLQRIPGGAREMTHEDCESRASPATTCLSLSDLGGGTQRFSSGMCGRPTNVNAPAVPPSSEGPQPPVQAVPIPSSPSLIAEEVVPESEEEVESGDTPATIGTTQRGVGVDGEGFDGGSFPFQQIPSVVDRQRPAVVSPVEAPPLGVVPEPSTGRGESGQVVSPDEAPPLAVLPPSSETTTTTTPSPSPSETDDSSPTPAPTAPPSEQIEERSAASPRAGSPSFLWALLLSLSLCMASSLADRQQR
uniref:Uncharacterized protein n=1 Tax=Chromera velia CCMP2878 TaxID=1169474 RepID=A0A0G4H322_9ALVE|eukprot:Cvel_5610.t1-p1 / transcript=Cvel_5610.t1 / gene=Cvel_5610 / organism=Chromera_velia_CCMP2878 / gene_product=hypothetical protein / transcript_product=hypothetical protein / location=Cvel_scaffold264:41585-43198(+) / protein_length=538 / sequence_SO=supercontig / SO=protein_coding / is_pseudo=false